MNPTAVQTDPTARRDLARELSGGEGFVDIKLDDDQVRGKLVEITPAGMTFKLGPEWHIDPGDELAAATVRLGRSIIHGDLLAVDLRRTDATLEVQALFHPCSSGDEDEWISTVSGASAGEENSPALAIRCGSCHSTLFLLTSREEVGSPLDGACTHCFQRYALPGLTLVRMSTPTEKASLLAREHRIDSPAAYSVLFGILTLDRCVKLCGFAAKISDRATGPRWRDLGIDPKFRTAIDAGWLTVAQALQRGPRAELATRLVDRHGLDEAVALDVADNKIRLIHALADLHEARPATPRGRPQAPRRSRGRIALIVILILGVGFGAEAVWSSIDAEATRKSEINAARLQQILDLTDVQYGDQGRVVEIAGSAPGHVLIAFCGDGSERARKQPVEIIPTTPPEAGARLGVFLEAGLSDSRWAIRIERRGGARRWVAGGDGLPIEVIEAPAVPAGTPRFPVAH